MAYVKIRKGEGGSRGYISGVHSQKCSKFSIKFFHITYYCHKIFHLQMGHRCKALLNKPLLGSQNVYGPACRTLGPARPVLFNKIFGLAWPGLRAARPMQGSNTESLAVVNCMYHDGVLVVRRRRVDVMMSCCQAVER